MIRKAYDKLRAHGLGGLLKAVTRRVVPDRLHYFPQCRPYLEARVGLEVGGPSGIFSSRGCIPVYPVAARIDNCNFGHATVWEGSLAEGQHFVFEKGKEPGRQYISEASELGAIANETYDFVLSSHCLEHLANPLLGLAEWVRVLKTEGLFVLALPHKDGTFDHRRPVTTLAHLVQDFNARMTESDLTHLDEILALHDLARDPDAGTPEAFRARSLRNAENRCLHHHVFDTRLAVQIVDYLRLQILAVELIEPFNIIVVARKPAQNQAVDNARFTSTRGAPPWKSPFPSDRMQ